MGDEEGGRCWQLNFSFLTNQRPAVSKTHPGVEYVVSSSVAQWMLQEKTKRAPLGDFEENGPDEPASYLMSVAQWSYRKRLKGSARILRRRWA